MKTGHKLPINLQDLLRQRTVVLSFPGPDRSIKTSDFEAGRSVSRRYRFFDCVRHAAHGF